MNKLLHLGAVKTGTKFLQAWFLQHPQICYSRNLVAGAGTVTAIMAMVAEGRETQYRAFVTSQEQLSTSVVRGTPQASFGGSPRDAREHVAAICRVFAEVFPPDTVLYVTRGYASFLRSYYSEAIKWGADMPFDEFVARDPQIDFLMDYEFVVETCRAVFGKDKVVILPYELLRDAPSRFLELLEGLLGVEHMPFAAERYNESLTAKELYWYREISQQVREMERRTGRALYFSYRDRVLQRKKFRQLVGVLSGRSDKKLELTLEDGALARFRNRAPVLKEFGEFVPYWKDYLLE